MSQELTIYRLHADQPLMIVPAPMSREWMNALVHPNRCHPLRMGCAQGWQVLCPYTFSVEWNGGPNHEDLRFVKGDDCSWEELDLFASSHFGLSILSVHPNFLVRTPPGYDLLLTGPTNFERPGLQPLTALLETDHMIEYYAMSFLLTDPGREVHFKAGDPLLQFWPVKRGELEQFNPVLRSFDQCPWKAAHDLWAQNRAQFSAEKEAARARGEIEPGKYIAEFTYLKRAKRKLSKLKPVQDQTRKRTRKRKVK